MSNDVVVRDVEVIEVAQRKPVEVLAQVVEAVRQDSQESPQAFLQESSVPHGGE